MKKLPLGPYPLLSLHKACEARDKVQVKLLGGEDPSAGKKEASQRAKLGETFEEVARSWHTSKSSKLTSRYHKNVHVRLENNLFPHFCNIPVGVVMPVMVLDPIRRIEARGARTMAQEVRGHA